MKKVFIFALLILFITACNLPKKTAVPPTANPPTAVVPTAQRPTVTLPIATQPTTAAPTTAAPTSAPPTAKPPTAVPPTAVPATAVPPTAAPSMTPSPTTPRLIVHPPKADTPTATTSPGKTYVDVATGLCLGISPALQVITSACNGSDFQIWVYVGGHLLDYGNNAALVSAVDGSISADIYSSADGQKWSLAGQTVVNTLTGFCLNSNYVGQVFSIPCDGSDLEKWR